MRYDLEALGQLDIKDVLEALGAMPSNNSKVWHCFNIAAHKDNDRKASMALFMKRQIRVVVLLVASQEHL